MLTLLTYIQNTLIFCLLFCSCKSDPAANGQGTDIIEIPQFLDSLESSQAIIEEDVDGMLDKINQLDISIQMKNTAGYANVREARAAYKSFLRTQVEDFDAEEKRYMTEVFRAVNERLVKLNPDLILPQIKLAKIKLDHYGPDVYYTRGEVIFLPKNSLKGRSTKGQINVMLHEVWHIISRYYPSLKEDAYRLIGFNKYEQDIQFDSSFAEQILINPDGVNTDFYVDLGKEIKAIPIVKSSRKQFDQSNPNFFNYIQFDLYAIDQSGKVQTNGMGGSTIPPEQNAVFFEKIKDNTQYIIHPDEIIADNFMLAVNANYSGDYDRFSKQGLKLVQDLIQLLIKHKR